MFLFRENFVFFFFLTFDQASGLLQEMHKQKVDQTDTNKINMLTIWLGRD